jgi:N-acetylneuraminic acid mutarotase
MDNHLVDRPSREAAMSSERFSLPGIRFSCVRRAACAVTFSLAGALLLAPPVLSQAPSAKGIWSKVTPLLRQQNEQTTVVLDGRIYVMGGFGLGSDQPIARAQIYDVAKDEWSLGTPLPEPVHHAGAAIVGGKIYQVGGFHNPFAMRDPIDTVWAFDPAVNKWERRAPLPSPRGAMVVAAIGDLIYAAGGEQNRPSGSPVPKGAPAPYEPMSDLAVYDPKADRWQVLVSMHYARDHAYVGSINGRLYVAGGRDRPKYDIAAVEEYDPATRAWSERAPMPTGRSGGAAAVLGGKLYVFGGEGNDASPIGIFDQVEAFDPTTNAWTKFGPMPLPRHSQTAAAVGARIYLPGGATRRGGTPGQEPSITAHVDAFQP